MQKSFTIVLCYKIMISYDIAWNQKSTGIAAMLHFPYSNRMGTWQTNQIFQKYLVTNIHFECTDIPAVKTFKTYLGSLGSAGKREPVRLQLKKPPTANTPIIMISMTVSKTATAAVKEEQANIQASIAQCKKELRELEA